MDIDSAPADLAAAMAEAPPIEAPDRLRRVRDKVALVRDLVAQVADLEARKTAANKQLQDLYFKELPDLFAEVGTDHLGLEAEGNLPAVDAKLKPYYKANIAADWPPEQRRAGFDFLREQKAADLIRTVVTVEFGRGEEEDAKNLTDMLKDFGYTYSVGEAVPWNTLTAWLREQTERMRRGGKEFTPAQLDKIGGRVGKVVEVKPRRV